MKRMLNWFRLRKLESELERELEYHFDRRVSDLMHSGVPEPEARRRAALELGGATQIREEVRDVWLTRWLRDLVYDLRFSARSFLRSARRLRRRQCSRSRWESERRPPFTPWSIRSFCACSPSPTPSVLSSSIGRASNWPRLSARTIFCPTRFAAISSSRRVSSTAYSAGPRRLSISHRAGTRSRLPRNWCRDRIFSTRA